MTVCFFGHKDTPETVRPFLEQEIERLIDCGAECFLVGNQGRFDGMVLGCLRRMVKKHPGITYKVVLAYMPRTGEFAYGETMLPEGQELVHPRYAIAHRNRWMTEEADAAVVYVAHSWGGAARYADLMRRKGKIVLNLCRAGVTDPADQPG
jgi:hypothetical protein